MSSYKNLCNLGITPIKCENKATSDCLKEIHYAINEFIYLHQYLWLSPRAGKYCLEKLRDYREKLLKMPVDDKCRAKWMEVGKTVRGYIQTLEGYNPVEEPETDSKVLRKVVGEYVAVKDRLGFEDTIKLAKETKTMGELYDYSSVPSFARLNEELVNKVAHELRLS